MPNDFWSNEGFWGAMGGGIGGTMQVGGSNARVADWLAAFGAGSGMAVDRRQQQMEEERRRQEEEAQRQHDRQLLEEERQIRLRGLREAESERMRMDAAAQARDVRAANPYFMDPEPAPSEYGAPGQYAEVQGQRRALQAKQAEEEARHQKAIGYLRSAGLEPTGDKEWDMTMAESAMKESVKGPGTADGNLALSWEKFNYQRERDVTEDAAKAMGREDFGAKEKSDWQRAYQDNIGLVAKTGDAKGRPTEEIVKEARELTEAVYGPEPASPTANRVGTGRTGRIAKPTTTPGFSGSLPTAQAKEAAPTGQSAPPKIAATPTAKRLELVDSQINGTFPNLPPEVRAKLKARVMMAVAKHGMTVEQAMMQARAAAAGTPFGQ
jgi:hypothetical protein